MKLRMVQKSHTIYKIPLDSYSAPALIRVGETGNKIKKDFAMKKYTKLLQFSG